jgi:hypothetical protein
VPFDRAVERLRGKAPVATALGSAAWADTPLAIRERSIWSAHVNSARAISAIQTKIGEALDVYAGPGRSTMDRSKFVSEMRSIMREEGLDTGGRGLTNPASRRRLELIYNFQTEDAMSYGRWKSDQDPDALDAYPAQEFLRVESRRVPPNDWPDRWKAAGGRLFGGRMIALKTDPVWMALSRFGRPWPPFDYESGMGIEDVSREDAEDLGLLKPGETVSPAEVSQDFNQALEESVKGLDAEEKQWLELSSGGQVKVEGDSAKLQSGRRRRRRGRTKVCPARRRGRRRMLRPPRFAPKPKKQCERGLRCVAQRARPSSSTSEHSRIGKGKGRTPLQDLRSCLGPFARCKPRKSDGGKTSKCSIFRHFAMPPELSEPWQSMSPIPTGQSSPIFCATKTQ